MCQISLLVAPQSKLRFLSMSRSQAFFAPRHVPKLKSLGLLCNRKSTDGSCSIHGNP